MREFSTRLNKGKSSECRFSASNYVGQIMTVSGHGAFQFKQLKICFFFFQLVLACLAIFIVMLVIRPLIRGQKWGEGDGINVG